MQKLGSSAPQDASLRNHALVTERARDLEEATKNGPMRLFPEDQWEAVLLGPGIDGPNGQHTLIGFTQESVDIARKSLSWHAFPTEDRTPESFFVYGDGSVLVPRLPTHQPAQVRNPFSAASNLPLPPPPPFVPTSAAHFHTHSNSSSSSSLPTTPLNTNPANMSSSHPQLHTAPYQGANPPRLPPHNQNSMTHHHTGSLNGTPPPQVPDRSTQPVSRYSSTATALSNTAPSHAQASPNHPPHNHSQSAGSAYPGNRSTTAAPHYAPTVQTRPAASSSAGSKGAKKPGEYSDSNKKPITRATGISGTAAAAGSNLNANDPGAPPRCPDEINGYCRSWNILHQHVCSYSHHYWSEVNDPNGLSARHKYTMKKLVPGSPEFDYIKIRFINSWIQIGRAHV